MGFDDSQYEEIREAGSLTEGQHLGVAPFHLKGADRIAKTFGVTRATVVGWYRHGGPVAMVGRVYMAEYNALMAWLVARRRASDKK